MADGLSGTPLAVVGCGTLDGTLDGTLAPPQKQLIQLCPSNKRPGGAPVITLTTALGRFHVPQQRVHFWYGQLAICPHRTMAGHRTQKLVGNGFNPVTLAVL